LLLVSPRLHKSNIDQYVLWEDSHVGRIESSTRKLTLQLSNNTIVTVWEHDNIRLVDQDLSPSIPVPHMSELRFVVGQRVLATRAVLRNATWILGEFNTNVMPIGVIVETRTVALHVDWVADSRTPSSHHLNDVLVRSPADHVNPQEEPLTVLHSLSQLTSYQIGDRVVFLDREVETGTYGVQRLERSRLGGFDGNVYMVVGTETIVDVEWQDGTKSNDLSAKDLKMHLEVDEYEGWPVPLLPTKLI
jgi:ubiquitin-conjugating enzyme E2 O